MRLALPPLLALALAAGHAPAAGVPLQRVPPPPLPASCDDLDLKDLAAALRRQAAQLADAPEGPGLRFGKRVISRAAYAKDTLLPLSRLAGAGRAAFCAALPRRFSFYRPRGAATGLITAYYHPLLRGSRERGGPFQHPLYRRPPSGHAQAGLQTEQILAGGLDGLGLELLYLDDLSAAFTAHIEGSAEVQLPDGSRINVTADGHNGWPYKNVGRLLLLDRRIPRDQVTPPGRGRAQHFFQTHPEELRRYWAKNPHFVYFRETKLRGVGKFGELCPGRSAAVDPDIVPMGAALFLRGRQGAPGQDGQGGQGGAQLPLGRVALAQDVGAGIRGPGRVDLFFGSGEEAAQAAARLSRQGEMYVLLSAPRQPRPRARPHVKTSGRRSNR